MSGASVGRATIAEVHVVIFLSHVDSPCGSLGFPQHVSLRVVGLVTW